jgi:hypothetical protein
VHRASRGGQLEVVGTTEMITCGSGKCQKKIPAEVRQAAREALRAAADKNTDFCDAP